MGRREGGSVPMLEWGLMEGVCGSLLTRNDTISLIILD
jgi:hypothetical protein